MVFTVLKKSFVLAAVVLLLNPHPLISDAQMWGKTRPEASFPSREPAEASPKWTCFHAEQITIEQSEVLYNGNSVSMPQMQIRTENHWYEVSLGGDTAGDFDSIFAQWQDLVRGAQNVCLSIEFLQTLEPNDGLASSLWVIHSLKTDHGEWAQQ